MSSRLADLIVSRSNQSVVPQVPANIGLDDFSRYASSRKKILIGPLGHFSVHGQEGEDARIQCVMLPTNLALSGSQEAKGDFVTKAWMKKIPFGRWKCREERGERDCFLFSQLGLSFHHGWHLHTVPYQAYIRKVRPDPAVLAAFQVYGISTCRVQPSCVVIISTTTVSIPCGV